MDVDAISDERRQAKIWMYFVCNALGYRLMHWRPRGWEMKDSHLARRPFLYFWRLATHPVSGVSKVRSCSSRRENEKCRQKCRPNETSQPTIQPTHQTNQPVKKKTSSGPGWGAKNLLKRRQVRKPFSRPNLSFEDSSVRQSIDQLSYCTALCDGVLL
jgi:hypothetical protein